MTEPNGPGYEAAFRQQLRAARQARGLSQGKLARRAEAFGFMVEQPAIARMESGVRSIGLDEAAALALALDLSLVEMLAPATPTLPGIGGSEVGDDSARALRERETQIQLGTLRVQVARAAERLAEVSGLLAQGVHDLLDSAALPAITDDETAAPEVPKSEAKLPKRSPRPPARVTNQKAKEGATSVEYF